MFDKTLPTLTLAVSATSFAVPGTLTAIINASDNAGLYAVVGYAGRRDANGYLVSVPGLTHFNPQFSPPNPATHTVSWPITSALNGEIEIVAMAMDKNGNIASIPTPAPPAGPGIKVTVNIPVVAPDSTPPNVSLAISSASALVGQSVTLTAAATDNVGVTLVEFFRRGNKIGQSNAAPYTLALPAFTSSDIGTISYTARAWDAAGNSATSGTVSVTVSAAPSNAVYVNAASGNDADAGTAAAPFRTLAKAFATAGAGHDRARRKGPGSRLPRQQAQRCFFGGSASIGRCHCGQGSLPQPIGDLTTVH